MYGNGVMTGLILYQQEAKQIRSALRRACPAFVVVEAGTTLLTNALLRTGATTARTFPSSSMGCALFVQLSKMLHVLTKEFCVAKYATE